jgi:cell division protein FtsI (penicillin-binding protein 3)
MKDPRRDILWRVYLIYFGLVIFALIIVGKASYIQFAEKEELLIKAQEQEIEFFTLEATRGNILANDGSLLATSIPTFEIRMDVNSDLISDKLFYDKVDSLAFYLSKLFKDRSKSKYKNRLLLARKKGNRYLLIKNHVSFNELKSLRTFPIFRLGKYRGGLIEIRKTTREMPYHELARRTIGFENKKMRYFVGLEGAYSHVLSGKNGKQLKRKINNGDWIPVNDKPEIEPEDGKDILTTIDVNLQDVTEQSLLKCLQEHQAFQGCAVLMEVGSGEIHAIANLRYDSTDRTYKETYNYAIGASIEPGSTFKLASLIAVLEDNKASIHDLIETGNGTTVYYNRTMRDVHKFDDEWVTVKQVFEESSNVGVSKLIFESYKEEPEKFVDHIRRMDLDKQLGIELPGEGKPYVKDPSNKRIWYGTTLPWMSVGYELMITPLQLLTFYNAIANNGVMVKPMFVKEIQDGGITMNKFDTAILNRQLCSRKTLRTVQGLLEGVVENGTAKSIKDSLFKIAGKTGTALIANKNKGYTRREYNASFVGYFPADKPKYSCIVVINRPTGDYYYGGSVAAPVFKEIANKVFAYHLDINDVTEFNRSDEILLPESAKGYYYDLQTTFTCLNYPVSNVSPGTTWSIAYNDQDRLHYKAFPFTLDTIPDLTGMPLKDALFIVEQQGLIPIVRGKGYVIGQSINAGSEVNRGQKIILHLKDGKS